MKENQENLFKYTIVSETTGEKVYLGDVEYSIDPLDGEKTINSKDFAEKLNKAEKFLEFKVQLMQRILFGKKFKEGDKIDNSILGNIWSEISEYPFEESFHFNSEDFEENFESVTYSTLKTQFPEFENELSGFKTGDYYSGVKSDIFTELVEEGLVKNYNSKNNNKEVVIDEESILIFDKTIGEMTIYSKMQGSMTSSVTVPFEHFKNLIIDYERKPSSRKDIEETKGYTSYSYSIFKHVDCSIDVLYNLSSKNTLRKIVTAEDGDRDWEEVSISNNLIEDFKKNKIFQKKEENSKMVKK